MTTTEDIALTTIEREVRAHGAELVVDYHDQRNSNMLTAIRPPSMDPIGERVSMSVSYAQINASVFSETGGPNSFSSGQAKPTPGWVSITAGLDTNDQRVLAVVNLLVPAAEQERPPKGALCGDCGESIVDGEDPWEWSEDIGDFVHARCIDEPPLTGEEMRGMTTDFPKRAGILTVGELKAALEGVPDWNHVAIRTPDSTAEPMVTDWWVNIAEVEQGDTYDDDGQPIAPETGHQTFDLIPGAPVDTRQF